MTDKLRLVLIFGGRSGEHEVSLQSARSVLGALNHEKYAIYEVGITHDGVWKTGFNALEAFENQQTDRLDEALLLRESGRVQLAIRQNNQLVILSPVDVVFPVLHGTYGEDGTLQGLLEIQDVAYVGAGVLGASIAMDKAICKQIVQSLSIPVLPYRVFTRQQVRADFATVIAESELVAPYPLFVKPANLGSSVGISKASNRAQLEKAVQKAARYDRRILVESGIDAREIEISVLGNEDAIVSVPGEIVPGDVFYTYEDKYHHGDPETAIPAPLSDAQATLLQDYALRAYHGIDAAGMARVDFLLDKATGQPYFNEINSIPGFTRISMYPKLLAYSGLEYSALVDKLISLALERKAEQDETVRKYEE